jgi:two-component system KDP operon response regulator KdpE
MADEKQRILVVDDEQQITLVMRSGLAKHGYDVRVAAEGESALELFKLWPSNLVVTDLSMPNMGGLEFCRRLRGISDVPIIVLSVRGEESVKIEALDAGADDYVTKPFSMGEFLARVRATLRRTPIKTDDAATVIAEGDFRIDLAARNVTVRQQEVHLSPKEFELLVHLIRHPGKVLTHRALLSAIWGGNYVEQTEYLRVFVRHLRRKIEPEPAKPRHIITEPWIGYRFDPGT